MKCLKKKIFLVVMKTKSKKLIKKHTKSNLNRLFRKINLESGKLLILPKKSLLMNVKKKQNKKKKIIFKFKLNKI
jgi:hypothetical protein